LVDRYYDPATDQFLSIDPLVAKTQQPYAFTDDDPLNEVDPLGSVYYSEGSDSELGVFYEDLLASAHAEQLSNLGVRSPENWTYSQKGYDEDFGDNGDFAGKTISDVASSIEGGEVSPDDVVIHLVNRGGNTFILNTRSAQALSRAGIPRDEWSVENATGDSLWERQLTNNLRRAGLNIDGSEGGVAVPFSEVVESEVSVPWWEALFQGASEGSGDD
jgi:hypothetical protein